MLSAALGFAFVLLLIFNSNLIFSVVNIKSESIDDNNLDKKNLKFSKLSGKIHVENNWTATVSVGICTGLGTYSNPYVIEDLVINASGVGSCIWIQDTTEFFKIENCTLYNSGNDWDNVGILLGGNVDNGQLINNIIYNNFVGIFMDSCSNCTISGNTISNSNDSGMRIWYCNNNTISDNNMQGNDFGMDLNECNYNNVTGNVANNNGDSGII